MKQPQPATDPKKKTEFWIAITCNSHYCYNIAFMEIKQIKFEVHPT